VRFGLFAVTVKLAYSVPPFMNFNGLGTGQTMFYIEMTVKSGDS
jgi:hypothetical protein